MFKRAYISSLVIFGLLLNSCEDVIEVDLPTEAPRLIVDGVLRVDESQEFVGVEIKVTETSDFFDEIPVTQLENALIYYGVPLAFDPSLFESLAFSNLTEVDPGSGIYVPDPNTTSEERIRTENVTPETVFILEIRHKGRRYFSRTPYSPVVPIERIEQGDETLFDEDDTEIRITITDPPDLENYYVFDFGAGEFLALDDQFIDGQQFEFSYFVERNLEPGEDLEVSILGADQEFFNYVDLLIEQTENDGGVFETPAATVRGNVFDVTGLDNINIFDNVERPEEFALGYFSVVQEFRSTITIE